MTTTNEKSINTLNNLLEINNDRIEGYNRAVKETDDTELKTLFTQFSETSFECKQQLTIEIKKLGGTPIQGTRTTGKLYRAWMDIKAALTNKDQKAILNSCEYGEDVAVKNYEDALKDHPLGSALYGLIYNQYVMIKAEHDKIKARRDTLVDA